MARGQQKIQSQQKAAEKAAKLKKAQGNSKKGVLLTVCLCSSIILFQTMRRLLRLA